MAVLVVVTMMMVMMARMRVAALQHRPCRAALPHQQIDAERRHQRKASRLEHLRGRIDRHRGHVENDRHQPDDADRDHRLHEGGDEGDRRRRGGCAPRWRRGRWRSPPCRGPGRRRARCRRGTRSRRATRTRRPRFRPFSAAVRSRLNSPAPLRSMPSIAASARPGEGGGCQHAGSKAARSVCSRLSRQSPSGFVSASPTSGAAGSAVRSPAAERRARPWRRRRRPRCRQAAEVRRN